jgi:ubiquinone/menaquinone biosynthesis C-methylase UbiE
MSAIDFSGIKGTADPKQLKDLEDPSSPWATRVFEAYDFWRVQLNTPAVIEMLPSIKGMVGLDLGCRDGRNTEVLVGMGAQMFAVDSSLSLLKEAAERESQRPKGVMYQHAYAASLPFEAESFDFVTAFMSLMEIADFEAALAESYRVLKPGGFLQFSICHPCFHTPGWECLFDEEGQVNGVRCQGYFESSMPLDRWLITGLDKEVRDMVPKIGVSVTRHTLSEWINTVLGMGFILEHCVEPCPEEDAVQKHPQLGVGQEVAYFWISRCRKPSAS